MADLRGLQPSLQSFRGWRRRTMADLVHVVLALGAFAAFALAALGCERR
jgi:hypothetical protein